MPKKRLLLSALLAVVTAAPAFGTPISITVRNIPVQGRALVYRGHVFLPLRVTFESLNSSVWYNAQTRVITARNILHTLQLRVNDRNALLDGHTVVLEAPPRVFEGSVFVPVAFAADAMGAIIRYDPATHVLAVNGTPPGSYAVAQTPPHPNATTPPPDDPPPVMYPAGYYTGGNHASFLDYRTNRHGCAPNTCLPGLAATSLFITGNPLFPIGQYGSAFPVFMPVFFPYYNHFRYHFRHHFGPH